MLVLCLLAVVRTLRYTHWLKFHQVLSIVFLGLTLRANVRASRLGSSRAAFVAQRPPSFWLIRPPVD